MSQRKYIYLTFFLTLAFSFSFGQDKSAPKMSGLQSDNALGVQEAKFHILMQCFAYSEFKKDYAPELIKIIEQEDNIPDTIFEQRRASMNAEIKKRGSKGLGEFILSDAKTAAILLVG